MDVKISLELRRVYEAILPPADRNMPLLWAALQTCYEQQKAVILPEANHDWTMLRLQDFKSIGEYNHVFHQIYAKLCFCEKEPSEVDKIEKTLQTMLPSNRILQHQYRAKNYQTYSE
jgi:hypothetical protein